MSREHFLKHVLTPVIGFGLGGALWGWQAYSSIDPDKVFVSPFSYILGAIFLGVFGSGSLALFDGDSGRASRVIGIGTVAWLAAFIISKTIVEVPPFLSDPIVIFWQIIFAIPTIVFNFLDIIIENMYDDFLAEPLLVLDQFLALEFLVAGILIGIFYAAVFGIKILRVVFCAVIGFILAALLSPVVGNLLGNLLHSIIVAYLVTFSLIGMIFGLALVWGLKKNVEAT